MLPQFRLPLCLSRPSVYTRPTPSGPPGRVNPPKTPQCRRATHSALSRRSETRDQDSVVVSPGSVSPATHSPETQLQILGSLRKDDSGDPAAGADNLANVETPRTPD